MRNLIQLRALNAEDCVLLATIYAGAKNTDGVLKMRKMIKSQGIKTTTGWSGIEVGDSIHNFLLLVTSHILILMKFIAN
jgi:hypothetical protein